MSIQESLESFVLILSVSLSVATLSRVFAWFRQIPYTLLLVIVGLSLASLDIRLFELSPEIILEVFLPPLLFEAAWNLRWRDLKRDLFPVLLYAIVGVAISIAGVALALNQVAGTSLGLALLVGACLSATDPVSVVAVFREVGVEKRLSTLMEGESLFNDGVAVVAFGLVLDAVLATHEIAVSSAVVELLAFVGVGLAMGALIGFGISYLTQRFDLPSVEQSLTLVSAYGTYFVAERLGGSGVIATVVAGLVLGNFGSRIGMNPRTQVVVTEFWEFLAFLVNSIVFLLIGAQVHFDGLREAIVPISVAIAAALLARLVSSFGLTAVSNAIAKSEINWRDCTILWWGGLRGSVSLALALGVPVAFAGREEIGNIVFGMVLFTLLVQGITTKPLLDALGLIGDRALRQEYSAAVARRIALNRVLNFLSEAVRLKAIDAELYSDRAERVKVQLQEVQETIARLKEESPELKSVELELLRDRLTDIEMDTYAELSRTGQLNQSLESVLAEALAE